jgi:predicted CoA-binding protein
MPQSNDDQLKRILSTARTVASVGLSGDETKDSFAVGVYLKRAGYHLIPINPRADRILGERVYRNLAEVPFKIDVVQIFRPSTEAPEIVDQAVRIGASAVWMQEGIESEEAAGAARAAGLDVVMNQCMMQAHRRLIARLDTL